MKGYNECKVCHEEFDNEFQLQEHIKIHVAEGKDPNTEYG